MTTEEEFKEYKRAQLKRARVQASVFGILAVLCLVSMFYGFFERTAAEREIIFGEVLKKELVECQDQLVKARKTAASESVRANEAALEVAILRDHLEKSNSKK
jgi:hypothetical protein